MKSLDNTNNLDFVRDMLFYDEDYDRIFANTTFKAKLLSRQ